MDFGKIGDLADKAKSLGMDIPDMGDLVGKLNIPNIPTDIITGAFALLKSDGPVAAVMFLFKELKSSDDDEVKSFGGVLETTVGDKVEKLGVDDVTKILEKLKG